MSFVVLWSSGVLIMAALVLSLLLWRRQRDNRALLLTALLATIAARFVALGLSVIWGVEVVGIAVWLQLLTAVLGVGAVVGLDRVFSEERRRRRAISQVQRALEEVSYGLSEVTGREFCRRVAERVNDILGTDYTMVGELIDGAEPQVEVMALAGAPLPAEGLSYPLAGAPCPGLAEGEACFLPHEFQGIFPENTVLAELGAVSYLGVPLLSADGEPIGQISVLDKKPMVDSDVMLPALRIIASRTQGELIRMRQEEELRESEQRFRELFEESRDALFITTPQGRMVDANAAAVRLFGYSSHDELLLNFVARDHYKDPTDRDVLIAHLERDHRVDDLAIELRQRDGALVDAVLNVAAVHDDAGKMVAVRGQLRDVTKQRELERQVARSQRMEAVGRMAGGVAHDFNNMLTIIQGQSELLGGDLEEGSPGAESLAEITSAAQRAAAFTRRLLLLSRSKMLSVQSVDLNAIIDDLSLLLESAVGDEVELVLELGGDIDPVIADASEMEQVLLNLVINAKDAMTDGGRIVIATANLALDKKAREVEVGDRWVELTVEDDGSGIAPGDLDYIFDPFFTTKEAGVGTGLGLSTVFGIVNQLKGHVHVRSNVGEGTRFSIWLPSATSIPIIEPAVIEEVGELAAGSGRLLVVDDEPGVRLLLQRFLQSQGYEVVVASSGSEALERMRDQDSFDLLISDVMMPGMTGPKLAEQARRRNGSLPVLLMSGFANSDQLDGDYPLLRKPFTTKELGVRIREVLSTRS